MTTKFSKARLAEIGGARDCLMEHAKADGPTQLSPETAGAMAIIANALCDVLHAPDYEDPGL